MNKRQRKFLLNYSLVMFLGLILITVSGIFLYFSIKVYGKSVIIFAVMGAMFWLGLTSIGRIIGDSFSPKGY